MTWPIVELTGGLSGYDPDRVVKAGQDKSSDTFASLFRSLFRMGTGWLGWTPEETWNASPLEIMEARAGRLDMLKAIFGSKDEDAGPDDPTNAKLDRGGLMSLEDHGRPLMPYAAPRICSCGRKVAHGIRCACQLVRDRERKAAFDAKRPSSRERGYDGAWRKARVEYSRSTQPAAIPVVRRRQASSTISSLTRETTGSSGIERTGSRFVLPTTPAPSNATSAPMYELPTHEDASSAADHHTGSFGWRWSIRPLPTPSPRIMALMHRRN